VLLRRVGASASEVAVVVEGGKTVALFPAAHGYFAGVAEHCPPGSRYRYLLDGTPSRTRRRARSPTVWPVPPRWSSPGRSSSVPATSWRPPRRERALRAPRRHVHRRGTFDSAIDELDSLVELGVTAVEAMPIAQFSGTRNWGYDGVFPFAAQHSYGGPAAFSRFVDACHRRGLAVVLDVVYNHIDPRERC